MSDRAALMLRSLEVRHVHGDLSGDALLDLLLEKASPHEVEKELVVGSKALLEGCAHGAFESQGVQHAGCLSLSQSRGGACLGLNLRDLDSLVHVFRHD